MSRVHGARATSFKEGGKLVEYFKGDEVTNEKHIKMLDELGALIPAGQEELTDQERIHLALNSDLLPTYGLGDSPSAVAEASPAGGTEGDRITGDYASSDHKVDALQAEVDVRNAEGREIEVTGTGSGGNVLRADLEKALTDDDTARSGT